MTWSNIPPTKPGWYWRRPLYTKKAHLVCVRYGARWMRYALADDLAHDPGDAWTDIALKDNWGRPSYPQDVEWSPAVADAYGEEIA